MAMHALLKNDLIIIIICNKYSILRNCLNFVVPKSTGHDETHVVCHLGLHCLTTNVCCVIIHK